jgi:hypothetical protein
MNYLIHGSGGWGRVSKVYYPRVGPKGTTLVRLPVIEKKKILKREKGKDVLESVEREKDKCFRE